MNKIATKSKYNHTIETMKHPNPEEPFRVTLQPSDGSLSGKVCLAAAYAVTHDGTTLVPSPPVSVDPDASLVVLCFNTTPRCTVDRLILCFSASPNGSECTFGSTPHRFTDDRVIQVVPVSEETAVASRSAEAGDDVVSARYIRLRRTDGQSIPIELAAVHVRGPNNAYPWPESVVIKPTTTKRDEYNILDYADFSYGVTAASPDASITLDYGVDSQQMKEITVIARDTISGCVMEPTDACTQTRIPSD